MVQRRTIENVVEDLVATRDGPPGANSRTPKTKSFPGDGQITLFGEILDWMFAPLLLLWPLSIAITFIAARAIADGPFDRVLEERVQLLASQVRYVNEQPVVRLRGAALVAVRGEPDQGLRYQFLDSRGRLLAGDPDLPSPPRYKFSDPNTVVLRHVVIGGEELRIATLTIDPSALEPPSKGPNVLVQIAESQDKRVALANDIIRGVILPQFIVIPLALLLVWYGLRRGLRPLHALQEKLRVRRPDDLSIIDPREAPEEISPLLDAFNDLLHRVNQSLSVQRRFLADAAHQLKTPLAGLRTQAELIARVEDPAERQRSLTQLIRSSDRAAHLISQLLALARMENMRDIAPMEPLELSGLLRETALQFADQALSKDIDFGLDSDDTPAPVVGHPLLLRELFTNLIDNALRYTPRGGEVTVRIESSLDSVVIEVVDSGVGIAPDQRELVFERFYRVLGNEADGSGLGLAIAREIALQHQAIIEVHHARPARNPPGTRIRVEFPKAIEA
jgi:two-component system sensor histidine kinase TctE